MSGPLNNSTTAQRSRSAAFMERLLCILTFSLFFFVTCSAVDYIPVNSNLKDGDTILSAAGNFEMGFFTPGGGGGGGSGDPESNRYLAIWYKKVSTFTTVWVANRDFPVADDSGSLNLNPDGTLTLLSSSNSKIWGSNSSRSVGKPVAQLLDTGNFVIRDENDENPVNYVWQSFDYPGDTALPGMKFGKDLVTGLDRQLTPWKTPNDPSPGNFTAFIDTIGYPQFVIKRGSTVQIRPGPWNGIRFSGQPNMKPDNLYTFNFVMNQKEIYYEYDLVDKSIFMRNVISPLGSIDLSYWIDRTKSWSTYISTNIDSCDRYGLCGPHGSCDVNSSPRCRCLDKFEPSTPLEWNVADWSGGCKRKISLDCGDGEGFIMYSGLKLPDTERSWSDQNMNLEECEKRCKSNCNCTAYTNLDIRGSGSGCLQWFGDLIDIRTYTDNGQDIYIRMAASELPPKVRSSSGNKQVTTIIVILLSVLPFVVLGLGLFFIYKRRQKREDEQGPTDQNFGQELRQDYSTQSQREDLELPFFTLTMLLKATNNFSNNNKLGEGGFGAVYKGELKGGQVVAVKRLSEFSTQGLDEFKNEVVYVSKLQHRNLVKLLGCCIEGKEKMLIYEYMPNKGLDSFIFDKTQSSLLDWPMRLHIINGIARGLLYLHQDSRLRIIHRDLKASNILLDSDMNPKISDFGVARSFGEDESEANTRRVVGTYGYMAPEYAGDGLFSIKSDVFSFGVLVLEMISGKKNRGFFHRDHNHNLLGHAWRLHKEGRSLELVDKSLSYTRYESEVESCIQVGLLCVQQSPEDRPTMTNVVLMLSCKGGLPQPKQPGFFTHRSAQRTIPQSESSSSSYQQSSTSELTVTFLDGR